MKSTGHLIELAREGRLPEQVMINVHPQRWHDRAWPWMKELVGQGVKNVVKGVIVGVRGRGGEVK